MAAGVSRPRWCALRALARLFPFSEPDDVVDVRKTHGLSCLVQRYRWHRGRVPPPGDPGTTEYCLDRNCHRDRWRRLPCYRNRRSGLWLDQDAGVIRPWPSRQQTFGLTTLMPQLDSQVKDASSPENASAGTDRSSLLRRVAPLTNEDLACLPRC